MTQASAPGAIAVFGREHLSGVMRLFAAERWSYANDEVRAWRALTAPGTLTLVPLVDGDVAGVAQTIGDGEIQAFLSVLLVAAEHRRTGIARALVEEVVRRTPGTRLDLISCADDFYEALGFGPVSGFRLTRRSDAR